jgi:hypothetical protein
MRHHVSTRIVAPASETPSTSWWVGASRAQLQARALEERPRMASSKFGRLLGSGAQSE